MIPGPKERRVTKRSRIPERARRIGVGLVAVFALIQLVPYGHRHDNPPVEGAPPWDSPKTREIFFRACADCHSHETTWPWYSHVAPASWLVRSDVDEGREKFNVSRWGRPGRNKGDEAAEMVEKGEMPIRAYLLAHPEARLREPERSEFVAGLRRTFGGGPPEAEGSEER